MVYTVNIPFPSFCSYTLPGICSWLIAVLTCRSKDKTVFVRNSGSCVWFHNTGSLQLVNSWRHSARESCCCSLVHCFVVITCTQWFNGLAIINLSLILAVASCPWTIHIHLFRTYASSWDWPNHFTFYGQMPFWHQPVLKIFTGPYLFFNSSRLMSMLVLWQCFVIIVARILNFVQWSKICN